MVDRSTLTPQLDPGRGSPAGTVYTGGMNPLTSTARRALRAKAHALNPVVAIGQHGLTPAVLHEIDVALLAH